MITSNALRRNETESTQNHILNQFFSFFQNPKEFKIIPSFLIEVAYKSRSISRQPAH